jgi:hypothetical protein
MLILKRFFVMPCQGSKIDAAALEVVFWVKAAASSRLLRHSQR